MEDIFAGFPLCQRVQYACYLGDYGNVPNAGCCFALTDLDVVLLAVPIFPAEVPQFISSQAG